MRVQAGAKAVNARRLRPGAGWPGLPLQRRGNGPADSAEPHARKCAVWPSVRPCRATGCRATGSSAGVWGPTAPIGAPADGEIRGRSDGRRPRPCAGCCTMGRHCSLCRRRPPGSHARSHHSGRERRRGQRCRIPDICERLSLRRAPGYADRPGRRTGRRCQIEPGLEVLGHGAVQQGALGVAGVVGFGGLGRLALRR